MNYEQKYKEALERAREELGSGCFDRGTVEYIFPELKELEEERIRTGLINGFNECLDFSSQYPKNAQKYWHNIKIEDILAWLEKQGEQKPIDKVEPKFNFRVGQWIVATGKCVYLTAEIDGFNVTLVDNIGNEYVFDVSSLADAHLWTIQDAKDGDVLVHNSIIFIFMGIENGVVKGICTELSDTISNFGKPEWDNDYCPATKEQRDLLFTKMKEADYEWDEEKKESRKIKNTKEEMDLEKEIQLWVEDNSVNGYYQEDVYETAEHFFELGLKAQKREVYVVTRSEEHSDYVEAVFLSEDKAEEYCKPYNQDENSYARNITKVKIQ